MKIDASTMRPGNIVGYKDKMWLVVKYNLNTPGNLRSIVNVELKDIHAGTKLNERFRPSDKVERIILMEEPFQYLFAEGSMLTLMHTETFEQIQMDAEFLGDAAAFLQDGMVVTVSMHDNKPISVALPEQVTLEVVEAEPVVKGQTASSSYKPAVLENGVRVMVPPHVDTGTKIVVNTTDLTYAGKSNE